MSLNFNRLAAFDWTSGNLCQEVSSGIANGAWHHVVYVFDSGVTNGSALYKDGSQVATCSYTRQSTGTNAAIGWNSSNGQYFNGEIDEVKVFDRKLTATEIRNLYDANNAGISNALTIPQITPGVSQNAGLDMTVITDAPGYDAAISQNNNLTHTDTTTTIPAISGGSITTPVLWDEGNTKGLGFTLTGGVSIPAKWGTGPVNYKYAAIPGSSTTFFSRTGFSAGQKEVTNMQFKLDAITSQKTGEYTNTVTVTATTKP